MGQRSDELYELARALVEQMGYALVTVDDAVERGRRVFRFFIDHPRGITVGDCETVSREIEYLLDADFDFDGSYVLEVSSPGLDHELKREREYAHFTGRPARLVLREPVGGRSVIEGIIAGAEDGRVRVGLNDGDEVSVPLASIARAHLDIEARRARRRGGPGGARHGTGSK